MFGCVVREMRPEEPMYLGILKDLKVPTLTLFQGPLATHSVDMELLHPIMQSKQLCHFR